jgi:hypothetical protein
LGNNQILAGIFILKSGAGIAIFSFLMKQAQRAGGFGFDWGAPPEALLL